MSSRDPRIAIATTNDNDKDKDDYDYEYEEEEEEEEEEDIGSYIVITSPGMTLRRSQRVDTTATASGPLLRVAKAKKESSTTVVYLNDPPCQRSKQRKLLCTTKG